MEGDDDESDVDSLVLVEQAKRCHDYGESISASLAKDPVQCRPFLESLIAALKKREAALGRFTHETAQTYTALAKLYIHMEHPRAIVMLRTSYRIDFFLYGKCSGHISGEFKKLLLKKGYSENEVREIRKDVLTSARHEVEGDIMRRFGDRRAAALEYQKAAKIEELAFGKDNPDLAFLWRKLACLVATKKFHLHSIDFDDCDRPGTKWMRNSSEHLSPNVCPLIKKGDKYYQLLLYSKAIREYIKAAMIDRPPKGPKKTQRKARRHSTDSLAMERELRDLIASGGGGSSTPPTGHNRSQSQHTTTTRVEKPRSMRSKSPRKSSSSDPRSESDAESILSNSVRLSHRELNRVPSKPTSSRSNMSKKSTNAADKPSSSRSMSKKSSSAAKKPSSSRSMSKKSTAAANKKPSSLRSTSKKSTAAPDKPTSLRSMSNKSTAAANMLAEDASTRKRPDFEHVAVASSIATSDADDGSVFSNSTTRVKRKAIPFSATSLYNIMVARSASSRSLTGSSKPKSESTLSRISLKPATKLASKTMKRFRKKGKIPTTPEDEESDMKKAYSLLLSPPQEGKEEEQTEREEDLSEKDFDATSAEQKDSDNNITSTTAAAESNIVEGDPIEPNPVTPKDGVSKGPVRASQRRLNRKRRTSTRSLLGSTSTGKVRLKEKPREKISPKVKQPPHPTQATTVEAIPVVDNGNDSFPVFEDPTNSSNSPSSDHGYVPAALRS
eukprot:scaffold9485_cov107-Cylindrotheca_fusiformis.AAC.4